jgi:hypothetical protein
LHITLSKFLTEDNFGREVLNQKLQGYCAFFFFTSLWHTTEQALRQSVTAIDWLSTLKQALEIFIEIKT